MIELQTERLLLRPWKPSDYKDLYEYAKSEKVGPNAGWRPHKDEEESKEIIDLFLREDETWAIELLSKEKVIGSIGLHERTPDLSLVHLKQKEIGYVLNPAYWGNGYVPEAVNAVLQFGFEELSLDMVWCGHFDFNHNSKRVNKKCGFTYRFSEKKILERLDGKEVMSLYYSILREEYEGRMQQVK
ncbi:Protein N-acetyltransferase, RimJ/RimL family [Fictibacillus solisalsi]|uniref:Protein N-acetyltransferase, RimJ/RimL family n=1 Tax=Fictibacillus solisalsi TaxID=459525 RepID=A0A1G9YAI4_9BACL|nr:GNAT family N-acetyltransferase [Fictibacillus solisalsi]SDN06159.1 Protein N-acetyltransferase, RimJ/RimL family [Fictibacillus solisalsi]